MSADTKEFPKDVQVVEATPVAAQPAQQNLVIMAMDRGLVDPDIISKMMDLQERNERREAEKAYIAAMAAFKAESPKIMKDKNVSYGSRNGGGDTAYSHASLGNVTSTVNPVLAAHGLSASWEIDQDGSSITVTCKITHKLGHSESTSVTGAADNSGKKNSIQAVGSTISYFQRYTLLSILGLATHDQDDDGAGSQPVETLSDEQVSEIIGLMDEKNLAHAQLLKWLKCDSWENVPAHRYEVIKNEIKKAQAR